jgi:hypothetical protein
LTGYPGKLVLSSRQLTVELLPAWGAKLISLRTEPDGYEFLSAAPFGPHLPDPSAFTAADAYGFDDMFPGVYPQAYPAPPWQHEQIADHGNVWYRAWDYCAEKEEATLWVEDERIGWRFAKTLRFSQPYCLEIRYRAENHSSHPLYWLYCAHILCSYRADVELELPAGRYRRLETLGQLLPEECQADAAHLLRPEALPPHTAAYYVSDEIGPAHCIYRDRAAGKVLRLGWSAPLAYLGVWYNHLAWTPEEPLVHVGLEPTSAANQDLAKALQDGHVQPLEPGGHVSWSITLSVM